MVKLSTKMSFEISLELQAVKKLIKTSSNVLKVVKETIRTTLQRR
jgi:hypothetical protein